MRIDITASFVLGWNQRATGRIRGSLSVHISMVGCRIAETLLLKQ